MNDAENLHEPSCLKAILAETEMQKFGMASESLTGALLRTLAHSKPRAIVLELGTGTGVATSWLLDGMDENSSLISVEKDVTAASVAIKYLGIDPRVKFIVDEAERVLGELAQMRFDLIFADTWVGKYTHLNDVLALLNEKGLYVIDDMLPQANWPDGHADKVKNLITILESRKDLLITKLSWSSGIIIATKRMVG